jgi:uncharacterized membrane protein
LLRRRGGIDYKYGGVVKRLGAPRHLGFYLSVAAGLAAALLAWLLAPRLVLLAGVNTFFFAYLVLAGTQLFRMDPAFLRKHAAEEDAPAPLILAVMAVAVTVSAVSLFLVLIDDKRGMPLELALSIASVALGWFAIHTMWAMHYAYEYYEVRGTSPRAKAVKGGLEFPGGEDPDGTAFLYFSYVVGMTAQTSDTAVSSNAMRRLVTLHGVFAFFFNTILVAAAVNIAIALAR